MAGTPWDQRTKEDINFAIQLIRPKFHEIADGSHTFRRMLRAMPDHLFARSNQKDKTVEEVLRKNPLLITEVYMYRIRYYV